MNDACVVLTTTGTKDEADRMARSLVEARLAACVQRLPIASVYQWKGAIEEAGEFLLLIKTTVQWYPAIEAWIGEHHSYEVPEVVMLPAARVAPAYLAWIGESTGGGASPSNPPR